MSQTLYVVDLEFTGLLPVIKGPEDLHVMAYARWFQDEGRYELASTSDPEDVERLFGDPHHILVGHNLWMYDAPAVEKCFGFKVQATIIDTLFLSWYLEPTRQKHGLERYGEEFGVPKPEITDWENLSYEEYAHRCEKDVRINIKLWHRQKDKLKELYPVYDDRFRFMNFLQTKGRIYKMQQDNPFRLDTKGVEDEILALHIGLEKYTKQLILTMPEVPVKAKKKKPARWLNKEGELTKLAHKWLAFLEEQGLPEDTEGEVEYIKGYKSPNPLSVAQVKDWLFELGWEPETFEDSFRKEGVVSVPQVKLPSKELCPSVLALADDHPEIHDLKHLSLIQHRLGYLKGFLRDQEEGFINADIGGLTNTLRIRHRKLVNLPKPSAPFAEKIRASLLPPEGHVMIGSDISALESQTRNHFVAPLDPTFVEKQSAPNFDPHLEIACVAGLMEDKDTVRYQELKAAQQFHDPDFETLDDLRQKAKTVNYSAMYGVGKVKLAKTLKIKERDAKKLLDAYWDVNWSVKHFSNECRTKETEDGQLWVLNPLNRFWYSLRNEKDIFSTINQSAGDYIHTLWMNIMIRNGVVLHGNFHDEIVTSCPEEDVPRMEEVLHNSMAVINQALSLNVEIGIDVKTGKNYADVH